MLEKVLKAQRESEKIKFHSPITFYKIICYNYFVACMAELVDAIDSKSIIGNYVWVRVPPPAPNKTMSLSTIDTL